MHRTDERRQRAYVRRRVSTCQSAQTPPSARLVAKNLGTDLQTPSRVGPRTFYASTQTPPNAPGSAEFRLKSKKMRKTRRLAAFGRGRFEPPDPSIHARRPIGTADKKRPISSLWRDDSALLAGRQFPNRDSASRDRRHRSGGSVRPRQGG
jgi:hypothetical protein